MEGGLNFLGAVFVAKSAAEKRSRFSARGYLENASFGFRELSPLNSRQTWAGQRLSLTS